MFPHRSLLSSTSILDDNSIVIVKIIQTFMYVLMVGHSISCTVSVRMSGCDDQFLNEVVQCQNY